MYAMNFRNREPDACVARLEQLGRNHRAPPPTSPPPIPCLVVAGEACWKPSGRRDGGGMSPLTPSFPFPLFLSLSPPRGCRRGAAASRHRARVGLSRGRSGHLAHGFVPCYSWCCPGLCWASPPMLGSCARWARSARGKGRSVAPVTGSVRRRLGHAAALSSRGWMGAGWAALLAMSAGPSTAAPGRPWWARTIPSDVRALRRKAPVGDQCTAGSWPCSATFHPVARASRRGLKQRDVGVAVVAPAIADLLASVVVGLGNLVRAMRNMFWCRQQWHF